MEVSQPGVGWTAEVFGLLVDPGRLRLLLALVVTHTERTEAVRP